MKTKIIITIITLGVFASWHAAAQPAPPPGRMTYQGQLRSGEVPLGGGRVDVTADVYSTWDVFDPRPPEAGTTNLNVLLDASGLFTMKLDLPAAIFDGRSLWLELGVRTNGSTGPFTRLEPRQPLAPTPYAFHAVTSQSAATAANAATATVASNYTGQVADAQLSTNVALLSSNATFSGFVTFRPGHPWDPPFGVGSTGVVVNLDSDTLDGKHASDFWQLGGNNLAVGNFLGSVNNQTVEFRVGGLTALRLAPPRGGGPPVATVLGGDSANNANNVSGGFIGGGGSVANPNILTSDFGLVVGGENNAVNGTYSSIVGGSTNWIQTQSSYDFIGGGLANTIWGHINYSTIGGGRMNEIHADYATIAGGDGNIIHGQAANAAIGGGHANYIKDNAGNSTIPGGNSNTIETNSTDSVVAGGFQNTIGMDSEYAAIGGGGVNLISSNADNSVIGGGNNNLILPDTHYATIPGGQSNVVAATYGFAAGQSAMAMHQGTFVWADSQPGPFASTAQDTFIIRATNGVGINTASPASALDVNGTVTATSFSGDASGLSNLLAANLSGTIGDAQLNTNIARLSADQTFTGTNIFNGRVGIGTATPGYPLEVAGPARVGNLTSINGESYFAAGSYSDPHTGSPYDAKFGGTVGGIAVRGQSFFAGKVGIGKNNPGAALDVNGTVIASGATINGAAQVMGLLRSGSEAGTPEAPSPAGLIIRRINSTSMTAGTVVARTDTMTLERDGSPGGFNIRFAPATGNFMVSSMQAYCCGYVSSTYGNSQYVSNPGSPAVYNIVSTGYNIVYFHCMFGRTDPGGHITEVSLVRFNPSSSQWFGTVTSTVNQ